MAAVRPQLRGLLASNLKKHVVVCTGLTLAAVFLTKHFVHDARLKTYEEFYKNYNPEKEFERLRDAGAYRSVKPASEEKEKGKKK